MANSSKPSPTESEAFELIELAIDANDLLTRAFRVIEEACEVKGDQSLAPADEKVPEFLIN